jgi:MoaA/NifB/PqqE/SkfB family radical SAM enzyme
MAKPAVNLFLLRYLRKFRLRRVDGQTIVHSHLPPLESRAYSRFIAGHLLKISDGPSHAQIAVTNVFWLGLTGGEPLLQKDLVAITGEAAPDCAVKLFTTGCGLTPALARDLKSAGLFSVSISLDHWTARVHDAARGYPGAFRTALDAIDTFKAAGLHVGVSAVLTRDMIRGGGTETFLGFLEGLGLDEAWLSEAKPSARPFWSEEFVVTEDERRSLVDLQDRANARGGMTVNYLGHFEDGRHFGCNAGWKFVYVDPFGEVGPCVFAPLSFGNVRERSLGDIWAGMRARFAPGSTCFMNANYALFPKHFDGRIPLSPEASHRLMDDVRFGPPGRFVGLLEGPRGRRSV